MVGFSDVLRKKSKVRQYRWSKMKSMTMSTSARTTYPTIFLACDEVNDVEEKSRMLLTLARSRSASSGSGGGWRVLGSGKNVKVLVGEGVVEGVARLEDAEVVCVVVDEWGGVVDCTAAPKIALC